MQFYPDEFESDSDPRQQMPEYSPNISIKEKLKGTYLGNRSIKFKMVHFILGITSKEKNMGKENMSGQMELTI